MKQFLIVLVALSLVACVAKSPQQVTLTPEPVTPNLMSGEGMALQLEVMDKRPSEIVGSRGGVYEDTSLITLEGNVEEILQQILTEKLQQAGFSIESNSDVRWSVELTNLTYELVDITSAREEIRVNCVMNLTIYKGASRFRNEYRAFRTEEVLTIPSDEKNATLINQVVTDTIASLLQDSKITEFLKTH